MIKCWLLAAVSFPFFDMSKDVLKYVVAPFIAVQSLHILRNLYFITSRTGQSSSSQYSFVNLVAIDILAQYPELAENFLRTIKPVELGQILLILSSVVLIFSS